MRRAKRKATLSIAGSLAALAALSSVAIAANGPFGFSPIPDSANSADYDVNEPFIIPDGYSQTLISGETDLNIYGGGSDDWNDMNTVNETGPQKGRYLYRTHEVRGNADGGAVSVVDLKTGEARVLVQDVSYDALDGIRWTPWGTILFAEEVTDGRLLEIVLEEDNPMYALGVFDRPAVGRLAHEGIDVGPDGEIYVVDEFRGQRDGLGGGIYKFVPDRPGNLSSGDLYALRVPGGTDATGQAEWVGPIDPLNARQSGTDAGGTGWNRPEDIEIIDGVLYVAVTEGTYVGGVQQYDGKILALDLDTLMLTEFVKPGVNVAVETSNPATPPFQTGFDNPDNLAESPDGRLVIAEDNAPSDIWFARDTNGDGVADEVELFASLTDYQAEATGIYWGKDPKTMFVNVQHSQELDGDATWVITKDQDGKDKGKDDKDRDDRSGDRGRGRD